MSQFYFVLYKNNVIRYFRILGTKVLEYIETVMKIYKKFSLIKTEKCLDEKFKRM